MTEKKESKAFVPPFKISGSPVKRGSFAYWLQLSFLSFVFLMLTTIGPSIVISYLFHLFLGLAYLIPAAIYFTKKIINTHETLSKLTEVEYNSCFGYELKNNHMQDYFIEQQNRCPLGSLSLEHVTNTASASYNLYGPGSNNPY